MNDVLRTLEVHVFCTVSEHMDRCMIIACTCSSPVHVKNGWSSATPLNLHPDENRPKSSLYVQDHASFCVFFLDFKNFRILSVRVLTCPYKPTGLLSL